MFELRSALKIHNPKLESNSKDKFNGTAEEFNGTAEDVRYKVAEAVHIRQLCHGLHPVLVT
jgi:hypothetical protein